MRHVRRVNTERKRSRPHQREQIDKTGKAFTHE